MSEEELKLLAIQKYADLQRIKRYGEEEILQQEKTAELELKLLGISVEDLLQ